MPHTLSDEGISKESVLDSLNGFAEHDADWRRGRTFGLVYYPGKEAEAVLHAAYQRFFFENGLNPALFKSLKRMESEVISMTLDLLNAPEGATGNMTSGGTESIICAMKSARKRAQKKNPSGKAFNVVLPETAHPAFNKAADYLGVEIRPVKCGEMALAPDMGQMRALIDAQTIMLVGSAPAYPHGFIDSLEAINGLAIEHDIWFHVDACVGGYLIPFLEQLGYPVPKFDFRLTGVRSISLDMHKFGYGPKGASVVVYRNAESRKGQFYVHTAWPGGLYASASVSGTRPGGAIAGSWAIMRFLGKKGYRDHAAKTMAVAQKIQAAIHAIEGLEVVGRPLTSVFSFQSTGKIDIYRLGDELSALGWNMDRQLRPESLHITVSFGNVGFEDEFIHDLNLAVKKLSTASASNLMGSLTQGLTKQASRMLPGSWIKKMSDGAISSVADQKEGSQKTAPLYGMMGELSGTGTLDEMMLDFLDAMNRPAK